MNIHDIKRDWNNIAAFSRSRALGFSKVKFPMPAKPPIIVHLTGSCDICQKEAIGVVVYGDVSICAVCCAEMHYCQEGALAYFQKHIREKAIEDGLRKWGKTPQ